MKRLSTLLLALVCAAGTLYAGYGWTPDKKYCKWGDNFKFDHAFEFHNAGAYNNTYGDGNVDFQQAQGVIAFSYMAWAEYKGLFADNYLAEKVVVYLTASGKDERKGGGVSHCQRQGRDAFGDTSPEREKQGEQKLGDYLQ